MSSISSFTTVLRTNYVPTSSEIDVIEQTVEAPNAEIGDLEAQSLQLQEQLDTKKARRENLSRSIAEHQNLLTPFRCLPDDILSEIFMACIPTQHEALMHHSEPPLIFGCVCRRWRSLAYRTPYLWTTLHIAIPTPPTFSLATKETVHHFQKTFSRNVYRHLSNINIWLDRSKACPLTISIHDPYPSSSSRWSDFPAKPYYELMLKFSNRIRRLELDVSQQSTSDLLAIASSTSFPYLRVLHLKFQRRLRHSSAEKWGNAGLLNVPNLTCLSVSMCPLPLPEMSVNWSHLTHIRLAGSGEGEVFVSDVQKIFTRCPLLHYCNIDIECSLNALTTRTPFSLPYLHTLIIIDDSFCLGDLFEFADIPSLRELSYHYKLCPASEKYSALLAILLRTNGRVECLTTNIQFFTLANLVECFDMTPSLTHLTNTNCSSGSPSSQRRFLRSLPVASQMLTALLDLLIPAANRPPYLPKLQVVNFDSTDLRMEVSDREILNFIQRRMDNTSCTSQFQVAALTEVSFVLTREMEMDVRAQLSDDITDGMKLHLTYLGRPFQPQAFARSYLSPSPPPPREVDEARYL